MRTAKCTILSAIVAAALLVGCGASGPTATSNPPTAPPDPTNTAPPDPTNTSVAPPSTSAPAEVPSLDQTWPTKRQSFAMAYDPAADQVLIFCGYDVVVNYRAWLHEDAKALARDEWAYDVALNRLELLSIQPYSIYNQAVYDAQSQRLIGFGPEGTAVYDPETGAWEKMQPAEEPPLLRFRFGMAYDSQSDRIIVFGGESRQDDTWAYDYESNTWTEMTPEVSPSYRWGHAMAYDAESDRIIMWGAEEVARLPMSDEEKATVWAYDYESNTWTAIESKGGPSYRGGHTMVYHPGTDRIILFGGHQLGDVEFSDETWAYDYNTNTWSQLAPAEHPSGRRVHDMVYDETADKMVLFGGIAGNFLKEEVNDDMWIFDPLAEEWSQVLPGSTNP